MFRSAFALDPKEISLLEPRDFTDLINRLLFAEAGRSGIPPADVGVTVNISTGDGGIDARARAPDRSSSRWIRRGLSIFQFKKGKITPAILKKEWRSERVQEAVLHGAWYVWVTGDDLNDKARGPRTVPQRSFQTRGTGGQAHTPQRLPTLRVGGRAAGADGRPGAADRGPHGLSGVGIRSSNKGWAGARPRSISGVHGEMRGGRAWPIRREYRSGWRK